MISALVGHLVGDYLLQNDWMALWKKQLVLLAWWPLWTAIPLFVTHYIQDRTFLITRWMDLIGQKEFRTGICSPWSVIVVDNVWHILTIWIIWKLL